MGQQLFQSAHQDVAMDLSSRLAEAADRLERADNPADFIASIRANRAVWLRLSRVAQRVGYVIPERFMRASLSISSGRRRLDDHNIELLISMDRQVSAAIAESAAV